MSFAHQEPKPYKLKNRVVLTDNENEEKTELFNIENYNKIITVGGVLRIEFKPGSVYTINSKYYKPFGSYSSETGDPCLAIEFRTFILDYCIFEQINY